MKKFIFLLFVWFVCGGAFAQELIVQHNAKGLYLVHTVVPKENFYSLGRLYNVAPKDIAAFNGLEMERGLTIDQTILIPLTAQNFSQAAPNATPVYYVVGDKEGLYRVSLNNNKVQMASLRKWNNLSSDAIAAGQKLIVGFLVSPQMSTAATSRPVTPEKQEEPVQQKVEEVALPRRDEEKPVQKAAPVQKAEVAAAPTEKKPEKAPAATAVNDGNGGFFKAYFEGQKAGKEEMATAGIFKTASGWQDAKYYALIDNVEPGTIIRIVNPNNNKAVYAKVLDKMSGIRQNQGYDVRISNAAATALDITDTEKFFVRVSY